MTTKGRLKTCKRGHQFYKSSNCPVCPVCEKERKPKESFLAFIAAPARRAIEREHIKTLSDLSRYSEKEILALHGMGKSTLPKLQELLKTEGLAFKTTHDDEK